MARRYDFESKRDWAKGKMVDAVERGDISDAQKYNDISRAYDYRAKEKEWKGWL